LAGLAGDGDDPHPDQASSRCMSDFVCYSRDDAGQPHKAKEQEKISDPRHAVVPKRPDQGPVGTRQLVSR
jgi:hypothetical protein